MKGSGVQNGQASAKVTSTEQRVASNDINQVEDTNVEVRERRSTRRATIASWEIQNQRTITLETVSQKVSHSISIQILQCVKLCFGFLKVEKLNTTNYFDW
jgi:hypothetical protein